MDTILSKYANLLVKYCLELKRGDQLFVQTTTLAEPLVREVYRAATRAGAHMEVNMEFREQNRIFFEEAKGEQLKRVSPFYKKAVEKFDAYLYIRAPFNLMENQNVDSKKIKIKKDAHSSVSKTYFKRTGTRNLRRNLCQYPTIAAAQNAGMSLEEYEKFVYDACHLFKDDPKAEWLKVRKFQKKIVNVLNKKEKVQYKGDGIDITFSTKGRTWINSDGQTNMPSGEVYTSPVENSVNGIVNFAGGIQQLSWIDNNDEPIFSAQGDNDVVVNYNCGPGLNNPSVLDLCGLGEIHPICDSLGITNQSLTFNNVDHLWVIGNTQIEFIEAVDSTVS